MARRTPAEIATAEARQVATQLDKARARVQRAELEVSKAQASLPRAEAMLARALLHPDLPEDVRTELDPSSGQEEIPTEFETPDRADEGDDPADETA